MRFELLQAKDLMQENIIPVSPELGLQELSSVFKENRITGAPVISENGRLIGVVSRSDVVQQYGDGDYSGKTVKDIMTSWVTTVFEDTRIAEVALKMFRQRVHRVFVTNATGDLVGIISTMDIIRAVSDLVDE